MLCPVRFDLPGGARVLHFIKRVEPAAKDTTVRQQPSNNRSESSSGNSSGSGSSSDDASDGGDVSLMAYSPLVVFDEVHLKLFGTDSPVTCCKETLRRAVRTACEDPAAGCYMEVIKEDKTLLTLLRQHDVIGAQAYQCLVISYNTMLHVLSKSRGAPVAWMAPFNRLNVDNIFSAEVPAGRSPAKTPSANALFRSMKRHRQSSASPPPPPMPGRPFAPPPAAPPPFPPPSATRQGFPTSATRPSECLSVSACVSVFVTACLSVCLLVSACLSVSTCLSVSVCQCLSVYQFMYVCRCMSVCLSV